MNTPPTNPPEPGSGRSQRSESEQMSPEERAKDYSIEAQNPSQARMGWLAGYRSRDAELERLKRVVDAARVIVGFVERMGPPIPLGTYDCAEALAALDEKEGG